MVFLKPEQKTIPGLRERAITLNKHLGKISRTEILTLIIVGATIIAISLRKFVPALEHVDKIATYFEIKQDY